MPRGSPGSDIVSERLAQVPMFASCTTGQLQQVSRLATEMDVPAGTQLTAEGEPGHEFLIVLDGTATVYAGGRLLATLTRGDWFGEVALLDAGPRTATVTAQTPMTLAVVSQSEFGALVEDVPAIARNVLVGLASRLRAADTLTEPA